MNNKVDSLEGKFKILDGLLLEVIRREQMAMQELGALASRYHGNDSWLHECHICLLFGG